jgi:hypothetical protein
MLNLDSRAKNYIVLTIPTTIILGILIWQLIALQYYDKSSFYVGTLIILGYLSILMFLISRTSKSTKSVNKILSLVFAVLYGCSSIGIFDFSKLFNVSPLLFCLVYYLLLSIVLMVFYALGLIKIKMEM